MDISDIPSPDELRSVRQRKEKSLDMIPSLARPVHGEVFSVDAHEVREKNTHNHATLLSRGTRTAFFVTQDSRKYITHADRLRMVQNLYHVDAHQQFDGVCVRYEKRVARREAFLAQLSAQYDQVLQQQLQFPRIDFSVLYTQRMQLAGIAMVGAVSFTLVYQTVIGGSGITSGTELARATGQQLAAQVQHTQNGAGIVLGAADSAVEELQQEGEKVATVMQEKKKEQQEKISDAKESVTEGIKKAQERKDGMLDTVNTVLTEPVVQPIVADKSIEINKDVEKEVGEDAVIQKDHKPVLARSIDGIQKSAAAASVVTAIQAPEKTQEEESDDTRSDFAQEAYEMVEGHPIEKMLPYILQKDETVAAYMIAIAKKESNWGKRVPVLNGQDCYNYWGYRGQRKLMGSGGHTCFNSRQDAVDTVAKRIATLVYEYERETPSRMVVWKCGQSCAGHGSSAQKWIDDVALYYNRLKNQG